MGFERATTHPKHGEEGCGLDQCSKDKKKERTQADLIASTYNNQDCRNNRDDRRR